jgi:hypothetical protein
MTGKTFSFKINRTTSARAATLSIPVIGSNLTSVEAVRTV